MVSSERRTGAAATPVTDGPVTVRAEGPGDSVLRVVFDNPPVNALTATARAGLARAAQRSHDPGIRVVVLEGSMRSFCAGGDLDELSRIEGAAQIAAVHEEYLALYRSWHAIPVPTIAAIRGYALGGGLELALSCDLRLLHVDAFCAASGVAMGLVESVHSLSTTLAPSAALELLLTGRRVPADEAVRLGLAIAAVPDLDESVDELATSIAGHARGTLVAIKELHRVALTQGRGVALERSVPSWRALVREPEHRSAVARFLDRRRGRED